MSENRKTIRFILYAMCLCIAWFFIYDFWLSSFDRSITIHVVNATVIFLNLIGYNAEAKDIMIRINGEDVVFVYHACNGMILMALFAGFIIAFPGPLLLKLIFIPIGILIIDLLNILRVATLALNAHYFHQTLEFNHKYTFTLVVYAAIFYLWMLWIRKYSGVKAPLKKINN
ncbi:exosortase X [Pontibacter sp. MBLB2868]|uniref:exosortase X n=1 Tax=Pontibacter sp. MBLB2868 TaxID=3451555 RepID=UPI003F753C11